MLGGKLWCKACAHTSSGTVIVFVLEKAEVHKNAGNEAYRNKDFATAISFYTEGIRIQCTDKELVSKLYNNRSTVYFYLGNILNERSETNFLFTEVRGIYGYPYRLPLIFSLESARSFLVKARLENRRKPLAVSVFSTNVQALQNQVLKMALKMF